MSGWHLNILKDKQLNKIEQLKADKAKLEAAREVIERFEWDCAYVAVMENLDYEIEEEEKKVDKWYEAKQAIPIHIASGTDKVKAVAEYAFHLECQLSIRPVIWCVIGRSGYKACVKEGLPLLYTSAEKAKEVWGDIAGITIKPYTGEQE